MVSILVELKSYFYFDTSRYRGRVDKIYPLPHRRRRAASPAIA